MRARICKIRGVLPPANGYAALITGRTNLLYATGMEFKDTALLICRDEALLFTDPLFNSMLDSMPEAISVIPVRRDEIWKCIGQALKARGIVGLLIEEESMSVRDYECCSEVLGVRLLPGQRQLNLLRELKTPEEIICLREAQRIAETAYTQLLSILTPAMTEMDVAGELVHLLFKNGAQALSFPPLVGSGPRSALVHPKPSGRRLDRGFLMLDFGCVYGGFCSDMSRTICVGAPDQEMRVMFFAVRETLAACISAARPGTLCMTLDSIARQNLKRYGFPGSFPHALGHAVGLKVHEAPFVAPYESRMLTQGHVLALEPALYAEGRFGVRLENMILITDSGAENLTDSSTELIII